MTTSKQPETVAEAVQDTRLTGLVALRDTLARSIDKCESMRDLAALSRQLTDVLEQIEAVAPTKAEVDGVDEIAHRRASRRAGTTKSSPRTSRSG